MKIKSTVRFMAVVTAAAALLGCATAGSGVPGETLPQWVVSPPADTADSVYFIGSGSAADDAAARSAAGADLVSSVTRFLGVKVTSETTVTARDSLKEFTTTLDNTIKESSEAILGDFRIVDSYSEEKNGTVSVYLLGEYKKSSLLKERERIQAVFAEQREAVSGPEREGDSLFSRGEYYKAAVKYIEAASAASVSDIDNADIKFRRNMDKARKAVSQLELVSSGKVLSAYINQPFTEPFVSLVQGGGRALAQVPVLVVYKVVKANGKKAVRRTVVSSDDSGRVSFLRPPAAFVGSETLTMSLDLSSAMEKLNDVQKDFYPDVEALEDMTASKRVTFNYKVLSHAKEIPTGILVFDEDNSGALTGKVDTASGILEVLSSLHFTVNSLPVDTEVRKLSDTMLIEHVRKLYGDSVKRLIFGKAGIAAFSEENGMYTVKVSGDIKVVELGSGKVLYSSGTKFKTALGSNLNSAISAAFKQFGKEAGKLMANTLP